MGGGASSRILVKGGTVVNAYQKELADVYVENGIIVDVRPNIVVRFPPNCSIDLLSFRKFDSSG